MFVQPLKKMRQTQPYGVDWTDQNLYAKLGMKGHNGWDLSAPDGTEVFAVMDGVAVIEIEAPVGNPPPGYTSGYGIDIRIDNNSLGLQVIYGHLKNTLISHGDTVKAGQLIATADNTGISSGSHLHFGVRRMTYTENGSQVLNYNNGYFGYIDPAQFFPSDVLDLPVDKQYGLTNQTPGVPSEIEWMKTNVWFFKNLKRLMTTRERNAFRYGFWDLRTVLDPAMYPIWQEISKPEAIKRGIVK